MTLKRFWTFKDTKHYKKEKENNIAYSNVYRTFIFDKSFLLEVHIKNEEKTLYVIPLTFTTRNYPFGYYEGISEFGRVTFSESEITKILS